MNLDTHLSFSFLSIGHAEYKALEIPTLKRYRRLTMNDHRHDLERYIELRRQIAALEAEVDALKPTIAAHVHEVGDKLQFGGYIFRSQVSRSWNYSDAVAGLQKQLRAVKRKEVEQGVATIKKETRFVSMTPLEGASASPGSW